MQFLLANKILSIKKARLGLLTTLSVAVLAAGTTLIGIFALSSWAEASVMHHAIQHLVIFVSGVGFGGSVVTGYIRSRGDINHES